MSIVKSGGVIVVRVFLPSPALPEITRKKKKKKTKQAKNT
jgi:hypothetical protein